MCHCHRGIRQEPPRTSQLCPAARPSFCIVYIASWMDIFNMQRAALRRKREWHELDRL